MEIDLIEKYGAKVIGVGLFEGRVSLEELRTIQRSVSKKIIAPIVLPLTDGVDNFVIAIEKFYCLI